MVHIVHECGIHILSVDHMIYLFLLLLSIIIRSHEIMGKVFEFLQDASLSLMTISVHLPRSEEKKEQFLYEHVLILMFVCPLKCGDNCTKVCSGKNQ